MRHAVTILVFALLIWAGGTDDNRTSQALYSRDTASLVDTLFKHYYRTPDKAESDLAALIRVLFLLDDNRARYSEFERSFKDFIDNRSRYYPPEAIRHWEQPESNATFIVE